MKLFGKKNKKRGSTGLNHAIAYMHGLNNRLVGLQLTSGNVIGIVISAIQVTFGALIVSHPVWYLDFLLAPITSALAVAIERLSLGGLGMVRRSVTKLLQLADAHFEMQQVEQREPTELEEHNYQRQRKIQIWTMVGGLIVVVLGVVISGFVGDQFWQWVWKPAGEPTSSILGIACAAVISLGFAYSELFKKPSDEEVEDRVNDDRVQLAVLKKAETDLQIGLSLEAFGNVRADQEKKQQAVTKIEEVVQDRLEAYADRIGELAMGDGQKDGQVPLLNGPKEENMVQALPAPMAQESMTERVHVDSAEEDEQSEEGHVDSTEEKEQVEEGHVAQSKPTIVRSYYAQYRDVLIEALTKNPTISLNELAQLTDGCARSTVRRWKLRAEKELGHVEQDEQAEVFHAEQDEQAEVFHAEQDEQAEVFHAEQDEQAEEGHSGNKENDVAA